MAVTQFGIVYGIGSAQVRRFIYPTSSNAEIATQPLMAGEAVVACANGPYASSAAWQTAVTNAVTTAAGKAPGNPRCAVIDPQGNVVGVILADAAVDHLAGFTLVNDPNVNIGWTWTAGGGFVSPVAIILAKP